MERQKNFIIFVIILAGIFSDFTKLIMKIFGLMKFLVLDCRSKYFFFETVKRHNSIEQIPIFFNLILKIFIHYLAMM